MGGRSYADSSEGSKHLKTFLLVLVALGASSLYGATVVDSNAATDTGSGKRLFEDWRSDYVERYGPFGDDSDHAVLQYPCDERDV